MRWAILLSLAMCGGMGFTHHSTLEVISVSPLTRPPLPSLKATFVPLSALPAQSATTLLQERSNSQSPLASTHASTDGCYSVPVTSNTPTGIAGCWREGVGIASFYAPGNGVAMNFCTWVVRHSEGCGTVRIRSIDTGRVVIVPVVDFCDCYTNTPNERIVDLQYGVLSALGLSQSKGLYSVEVSRG
jgi:hypothetical protein